MEVQICSTPRQQKQKKQEGKLFRVLSNMVGERTGNGHLQIDEQNDQGTEVNYMQTSPSTPGNQDKNRNVNDFLAQKFAKLNKKRREKQEQLALNRVLASDIEPEGEEYKTPSTLAELSDHVISEANQPDQNQQLVSPVAARKAPRAFIKSDGEMENEENTLEILYRTLKLVYVEMRKVKSLVEDNRLESAIQSLDQMMSKFSKQINQMTPKQLRSNHDAMLITNLIQNNISTIYCKMNKPARAINSAEQTLAFDHNNIQALSLIDRLAPTSPTSPTRMKKNKQGEPIALSKSLEELMGFIQSELQETNQIKAFILEQQMLSKASKGVDSAGDLALPEKRKTSSKSKEITDFKDQKNRKTGLKDFWKKYSVPALASAFFMTKSGFDLTSNMKTEDLVGAAIIGAEAVGFMMAKSKKTKIALGALCLTTAAYFLSRQ